MIGVSAVLACNVRRLYRLFAARRSAQRHRPAHRRSPCCCRFPRRNVARRSCSIGGVFPTAAAARRLFVAAHLSRAGRSIAALIALHLAIVWRQKHSQFPGPGRTERNVVGSPLFPHYAAKSIAPAVRHRRGARGARRARADQSDLAVGSVRAVARASSPGATRLVHRLARGRAAARAPRCAVHLWGHTIPSPFWPAVLLPLVLVRRVRCCGRGSTRRCGAIARSHQLLDNPRDVPWRTGVGVACSSSRSGLRWPAATTCRHATCTSPITAITHVLSSLLHARSDLGRSSVLRVRRELRERAAACDKAPRVRVCAATHAAASKKSRLP